VRVAVPDPAAAAVFLVREQDDPDRPPRPQAELFHQAQRFPGRHAPAAIVGCPGADVPRIEMPADEHDFLRRLPSTQLADDVVRLAVRLEMRFHGELDANPDAALLQPLEPIGVFGRERHCRNLRDARLIARGARMRRPQAGRSDRSDQHRDRAERRRT
jgi:hypothetical protein